MGREMKGEEVEVDGMKGLAYLEVRKRYMQHILVRLYSILTLDTIQPNCTLHEHSAMSAVYYCSNCVGWSGDHCTQNHMP